MDTETLEHGQHGEDGQHPANDHADGAHGLHGSHGAHHPSDASYWKIFLALVAITAAEIALSYSHIGVLFLPLLLSLMTIKFLMVVMFFMHLRFDNRLFSLLFYTGLLLAVGVYTAVLTTSQFWVK